MGNGMVIVRNPVDLELWQERFSECRRSGITVALCEKSKEFQTRPITTGAGNRANSRIIPAMKCPLPSMKSAGT